MYNIVANIYKSLLYNIVADIYKSLLYDIVADISWKQSAGSLLIAIGGAQAGEKIANKDPQTLL